VERERERLLVSVVISTHNRCEALRATLDALDRQTIGSERYEVLVVDDGSSDGTAGMLAEARYSFALRTFRLTENAGIAAARNVGLRRARGHYVVIMADDLITPPLFLAAHLQSLERYPGYWVVGGFSQLPSLTGSPFGRYLDRLERTFEEARKSRVLAPGVWELSCPTARNLSLPRADLGRVGLFDEQFRRGCEDQDLAHRAAALGIRFLYDSAIDSLHNDQAGNLKRYCNAQRNSMHDTVLFCAKYPALHGSAPVVSANGYVSRRDGPRVLAKKAAKRILATPTMTTLLEGMIALTEHARVAERLLFRLYQALIGVYIFRGWRDGLRTLEMQRSARPDPVIPPTRKEVR
jgi:GT2 family glycosyltransferase